MASTIRSKSQFSFYFFVLAVICSITIYSLCVAAQDSSESRPQLRNLGPAPIFKAVDQNGKNISNADFLNKNYIVNFFFTSCQGPCPILMEHVRKLAKEFPNQDLEFLSFSVDPEVDTDEKLKAYVNSKKLNDPRIHLVKTGKDELEDLLNNGFKLGSAGEIINHSTRFVLIDKHGQIRSSYSGDYQGLEKLVSMLLKD